MNLKTPVSEVKGVGKKTEELLQTMGVYSVGDMLSSFPRDYVTMPAVKSVSDLREGEVAAVSLRVMGTPLTRRGRRMQVTTVKAADPTGEVQLIWFRMPYIRNLVKQGMVYVFYGRVSARGRLFTIEQPRIFKPDEYKSLADRLLPVYSLVKGLTNAKMTKLITGILTDPSLHLFDYLPEEMTARLSLCSYEEAVRALHMPRDKASLIRGRHRMVYDEFFFFLLAMQFLKETESREENPFTFAKDSFVTDLMKKLPFALTGAQERALTELRSDLTGPHLMQRLLQGDVGSGKTILAFLLMAECAHNGYQAVLMAPTEVLAQQHYETFRNWTEKFGLSFPVILLTGRLSAAEKKKARIAIKETPGALILGTHALFQEGVEFHELALVITDEQHRFGVKQREALAGKGDHPHTLVMSATPIPRTLAIILFGDLDISVIDEVPAKRLPIKNCVVGTQFRPKAYEFIEKEVAAHHQAYVICPLVEESEAVQAENVTDYADVLREHLSPGIRIETLHGRMSSDEKNAVMERFSQGKTDVLVSTTVVEVGVNVPNATVMMVENADRFGLAQLHQLRGRVGRGDAQSYCIFINTDTSAEKNERLETLNKSNDGFFIASEDLRLRGPGDFLGIRQSGLLDFPLADVYQDANELSLASEEVHRLLTDDPGLTAPEHAPLRLRLNETTDDFRQRLNL